MVGLATDIASSIGEPVTLETDDECTKHKAVFGLLVASLAAAAIFVVVAFLSFACPGCKNTACARGANKMSVYIAGAGAAAAVAAAITYAVLRNDRINGEKSSQTAGGPETEYEFAWAFVLLVAGGVVFLMATVSACGEPADGEFNRGK
jgi:hypothetical protein